MALIVTNYENEDVSKKWKSGDLLIWNPKDRVVQSFCVIFFKYDNEDTFTGFKPIDNDYDDGWSIDEFTLAPIGYTIEIGNIR